MMDPRRWRIYWYSRKRCFQVQIKLRGRAQEFIGFVGGLVDARILRNVAFAERLGTTSTASNGATWISGEGALQEAWAQRRRGRPAERLTQEQFRREYENEPVQEPYTGNSDLVERILGPRKDLEQ